MGLDLIFVILICFKLLILVFIYRFISVSFRVLPMNGYGLAMASAEFEAPFLSARSYVYFFCNILIFTQSARISHNRCWGTFFILFFFNQFRFNCVWLKLIQFLEFFS